MIGLVLGLLIAAAGLAAVIAGYVTQNREDRRDRPSMPSRRSSTEDRSGWIYFITAPGEDDAPVKVGMTSKDPCKDRLTDLRTMSPYPLRIIYKFHTSDRFEYEAKLHKILARHRLHGEWFDRDVAMALIEELKGAA